MIIELEMMKHELRQTTQHFSQRAGKPIKVVWTDGVGATDCENAVALPALDASKLTAEGIKALRGYVDHEAGGHMVHTPKAVLEELKAIGDQALHRYWNGLEDPRIDQLHCQAFPGAKKNIAATLSMVCREFNIPAALKDADRHLNFARHATVLAAVVGRKLMGIDTPEVEEYLALYPAEQVEIATEHVKRAMAAQPHEVIQIAREYMAAAKAEQEQQRQQARQQQQQQQQEDQANNQSSQGGAKSEEQEDAGKGEASEAGDEADDAEADGDEAAPGGEEEGEDPGDSGEADEADGEGGDGDAEAGEHGDGDPEEGTQEGEAGDEDGSQGDAQGGDEDGQAPAGEDGAAYGHGGSEPLPHDPSLSQVLKLLPQKEGNLPVDFDQDYKLLLSETVAPPPDVTYWGLHKDWVEQAKREGRLGFERVLSQVPAASGNMTKTLLRILAGKSTRDRTRGLESGRLDSRRLVQAAMGDRNVFYRAAPRADLNTFVGVLLDVSGSMEDSRAFKMIPLMTCTLGQALEATGVAWSLHTYTTYGYAYGAGSSKNMFRTAPGQANTLSRQIEEVVDEKGWNAFVAPLVMVELKGANERLATAAGRLACAHKLTHAATPTDRAVVEMAIKLLRRPEDRKVLVVVTDGDPDNRGAFVKALADCEAKGIDVIGIGIGPAAKVGDFKYGEKIVDLESLAKTSLQAVWGSMLK